MRDKYKYVFSYTNERCPSIGDRFETVDQNGFVTKWVLGSIRQTTADTKPRLEVFNEYVKNRMVLLNLDTGDAVFAQSNFAEYLTNRFCAHAIQNYESLVDSGV